ncbi:hypothetical protein [Shewanella woodyi]|uniref:Integrase family protein n=1 Tax=Shewanella woodyi (strain ATCC 51908 / MS32) TaxID=392500 RepID=B1KGD2_SHEWM|nr:hypothetical protein [Shewanella woodyi]ACA88269.1 hypothetical protein Swoo_4013 [Shewanella woodyi ATCC 51908]
MINKYLNKLQNDFNNIAWDIRIKNKSREKFPTKIDDTIEITPAGGNPTYLVLYSKKAAGKVVSHKMLFRPEYRINIHHKNILVLFLNALLTNTNVKIETTTRLVRYALVFLDLIDKSPHNLRQIDYDNTYKAFNEKLHIACNYFIKWCSSNGYCERIRTKPPKIKTATNGLQKRKDKLPQEASIIALGEIFQQVIPEDESLWDTSPKANHADAFSLSIIVLSLASPNRSMAEIRTLHKQELIEYKDWNNLDRLGKPQIRYSLMWKGSKGYKEYENHILSTMSDVVKRALRYMERVTAPYRILMQFWFKQNSTINELFPITNEILNSRLKTLKLTPFDSLTFVQLGFLLGLHQNIVFTLKMNKLSGMGSIKKDIHISMLKSDFSCYISEYCGASLIGFKKFAGLILTKGELKLDRFVTIKDIQQALFKMISHSWKTFPRITTNGGKCDKGNEVDIREAMWCLSGASVGGHGGMYAPFLPDAMEGLIKKELKGRLFRKYGYSERLRMSAHQFRHYLNHNSDINGLSHYIINAWSGRADSRHIQNYLHETEEDKIARIPIVEPINNEIDIRVHSQKEFEKLRKQQSITSITSVGFCTKDLRYIPCTYLSEFETQCTFCEQSCHIAHDQIGIKILKEDYALQNERLSKHLNCPNKRNENAKKWYRTHKANTDLLCQLIETLEDPLIPRGAVVRVITETKEIRIADLDKKSISTRKLYLKNMEDDIQHGLEDCAPIEKKPFEKDTEQFIENFWGDL